MISKTSVVEIRTSFHLSSLIENFKYHIYNLRDFKGAHHLIYTDAFDNFNLTKLLHTTARKITPKEKMVETEVVEI